MTNLVATLACTNCRRDWDERVSTDLSIELALSYMHARYCSYCGEPARLRGFVLAQPLPPRTTT